VKPCDMTTIHDPASGTFGDCSRAVIASLLEMDCDEVPHFLWDGTQDGNEFCRRINDWLRPMNLAFVMMPSFAHILGEIGVRSLHHEASGPSPRLPDYHHAVCSVDGEVTHDPHPSRAGVDVESWGVFLVLDPSKAIGPAARSTHYEITLHLGMNEQLVLALEMAEREIRALSSACGKGLLTDKVLAQASAARARAIQAHEAYIRALSAGVAA